MEIINREKNKTRVFNSINKSFFCIIFLTILLNFCISGILNINYQIKNLKNINFITAELQNNLDIKEKQNIEKSLLNIPDIRKVVYVDSFVAFQNLQKDLGIVIPRGENPLPDSMRIYIGNLSNLEKIQNYLDSNKKIKEYFIDGSYSGEINDKIKIYKTLLYVVCSGVIISLISIVSIFLMQIHMDRLALAINDERNPRNSIRAKNINLLPTTIAILIGTVLYFNLYFYVRQDLGVQELTNFLLSLFQIAYIQLIAILILIIFIWKCPLLNNKR